MKALDNMTNVEKADLLAKLFPEELQPLTAFMQQEAELFQANRTQVYAEQGEVASIVQLYSLVQSGLKEQASH